ncbi:MAG: SDR family oxidoreductase [Gammaproteobacteria bacterium]|nr:MAG: SDR family oxidoreductase [Gammaproteobacteria bacterium]
MNDFKDKVVLVTGAAGNLGQATVAAFAKQGARLVMAGHNSSSLSNIPVDGMRVKVDLTIEDSVRAMTDAVHKEFSRIDILANIAGGFSMGQPMHETGSSTWEHMMNLNARSVFYCCKAVVPIMLQQGSGRVINVSARAAKEGKAKKGPYCESKSAVIALTESLAAEHKYNNINVNCLLPGTIDTPLNRNDMPKADFAKWVPSSALADVIVFLASDAARCVTGASIPVYGQS